MIKEKKEEFLSIGDKNDEALAKSFKQIIDKYYSATGVLVKGIEVEDAEVDEDGHIKAKGIKIVIEENEDLELPEEEAAPVEETPAEVPAEVPAETPAPEVGNNPPATESLLQKALEEIESGASLDSLKEQVAKLNKIFADISK